jgi:cytidine deaminase
MKIKEVPLAVTHFETIKQIQEKGIKDLIKAVRKNYTAAYAPYSNFYVCAGALLQNGELVTATNQENASYPVSICAERVLLAHLSTLKNKKITAIAISYKSKNGNNTEPISPCGMCRQALFEYVQHKKITVPIYLTSQTGEILLINDVRDLLPLAFTAKALGKK